MTNFPCFPSSFWVMQSPLSPAMVWERGDCVFLPGIPERLTWLQWQQLLTETVIWLKEQGIHSGMLVAYSGSQRLVGLLCYMGVIAVGGRILMLNPALSERQRQQILQQNGVQCVLSEADFANFSPNLTACADFSFQPERPATLTLTSGSSGIPKAVVHSVRNHLDNARGVCELMHFSASNSWLLSLPLFHVSGQGIIWRWLCAGATLYLTEVKDNIWQWLQQVTHASLVPTQLQRYLSRLPAHQQITQHILLGGAYIPAGLIQQAQTHGIETYAGYGMTEMASTICASQGDNDNVGKPLAGREVYLAEGEIWVRGAGLAMGYWLDGQIVPLTNTKGWFATKDKGEWTAEGKLVVKGRLDNMFISGGENIQPEEIEAVFNQCEIVKNTLIVPIPDQEFGKRPVAFVEFHTEYSQQALDFLQNFAKERLEKFKLPCHYLPLDSEQWQGSGIKISRKQLQQAAEQRVKQQQ